MRSEDSGVRSSSEQYRSCADWQLRAGCDQTARAVVKRAVHQSVVSSKEHEVGNG